MYKFHNVCVVLILLLALIIFLFPIQNYGQHENVWIFNGGDVNGIDFNTGQPKLFKSAISGGEAQAMYCDENGKLLFYTNGDYVWDQGHQIMNNGNNIWGLPDLANPTKSSHQGTVIVPIPGDKDRFYIFSVISSTGGGGIYSGNIYYNIIDMALNNARGDIVTHKGIFLGAGYMEGITAIAGNHCNIWLLARTFLGGSLHAFNITDSGVVTKPVISEIKQASSVSGSIKVSTDGEKIVVTDNNYYLLDFNRYTGLAYNRQSLLPNAVFGMQFNIPEFSPDGSKLYAPKPVLASLSFDSLYQYDLTLQTAEKMYEARIAITDGANQLRLAPDGKIYFTRRGNIDRINTPNSKGIACDHEEAIFPNKQIGFGGGPNRIAIIKRDTILSDTIVFAPCFANVNQLHIHPLNDTTGWDYQWNTGATTTTLTVDTPGTYWINYRTPPCNFHTDTFHISFPNGVLPDIHIDTTCINAANGRAYTSTYPGDTVRYYYTWQNESGSVLSHTDTLKNVPAGTYKLRVQTAQCDTSLSFYIPEVDYRVSFQADSIVCQGKETLFQNTSDHHFTSFQWDFGNGAYSELTDPLYSYPVTGRYLVKLTGSGTICTDTSYQFITVDSLLNGFFDIRREEICVGESITFYPFTHRSVMALEWLFGDGITFSGPVERSVPHAYDRSGIFTVQLKTHFRACPADSHMRQVTVHPAPDVDLGGDTALCFNGASITLYNQSGNEGMLYYLWSNGETAPTIQARHDGAYWLQIRNTFGCTSEDGIVIRKGCHIDIPNAFSPNGDGYNDYFFPRPLLSRNVHTYKMQLFDRWGQLLFETTQPNGRGWDGRFMGRDQPEGVYVYRIEIVFGEGGRELYEGHVTLLR